MQKFLDDPQTKEDGRPPATIFDSNPQEKSGEIKENGKVETKVRGDLDGFATPSNTWI